MVGLVKSLSHQVKAFFIFFQVDMKKAICVMFARSSLVLKFYIFLCFFRIEDGLNATDFCQKCVLISLCVSSLESLLLCLPPSL